MEKEIIEKLNQKLPAWAIRENPMKKGMSVIHPMAIIERLNDCFGIGGWSFKTREIDCTKETQSTKNGPRTVYMSSVHGTLDISKYNIHIEQFGGSTNDDKGDALKGGATDSLTKIASYLNIGAEIYKGHGNVDVSDTKVAPTANTAPNKATPPKKAVPLDMQIKLGIERANNVAELEVIATGIKNTPKLTDIEKQSLTTLVDMKAMDFEDVDITPDTVPFNN
jgi:hypothetical protein